MYVLYFVIISLTPSKYTPSTDTLTEITEDTTNSVVSM